MRFAAFRTPGGVKRVIETVNRGVERSELRLKINHPSHSGPKSNRPRLSTGGRSAVGLEG
jgi:hypothetical protein